MLLVALQKDVGRKNLKGAEVWSEKSKCTDSVST